MPKFIVLMQENDDAWARLPKNEQDALMKRYSAWVLGLREAGTLVGGEAIGRGGRHLRREGDAIVDRPYEETRDVPTGFFLIEAADLTAATVVARGCPALEHGEDVVVRPIGHV